MKLNKIKILHVISGLEIGGTEIFLLNYINNSSNKYYHQVISLSPSGKMSNMFKKNKINIIKLNFKKNFIKSFLYLSKYIKKEKFDKVHTWLYHSNLIGSIASILAGNRRIIWSVRGTSIPQSYFSINFFIVLMCGLFSYLIPKYIICNGESVANFHKKLLYKKNILKIIYNGFSDNIKIEDDKKIFEYIKSLPENKIIVGAAGRNDKLKDYPNLFAAYSIIKKKYNNVFFIIAGRDMNIDNPQIDNLVKKNQLDGRIKFFDELQNLNYFFSCLDIFCLSSFREGFPNVLCEAMLNNLPCVSTECGDVDKIFKDKDQIVPVKNSHALFLSIENLIQLNKFQRQKIGKESKKRILENFSMNKCINEYDNIYNND